MSNQSQSRVAVIGGGVIGVSSAYHLARGGAKVWLITEGALASGASGRSMSWINSAYGWSEHYHQFRMIGIDRYRTLFARQPTQNWLRFDGGLMWHSRENATLLGEMNAHNVAHGYDSQLLTPDQVAAQISGIDPAAIPASGAIWNPSEGWVDLPSLIDYLSRQFVELGGQVITNAGRASVVTNGGRVTKIKGESDEEVAIDAALLATGAKVPQMAAEFGIGIPDATNIALLIKTQPIRTQLRAVLSTPRVSLRHTPDGGLAVDAGWTESCIEVLNDGTYRMPTETIEELLAEASHVLAGRPPLSAATYSIG